MPVLAVQAGRPVEPDLLVRPPPAEAGTTPVRVRTDVHERFLPEVKHVATLGPVYRWRRPRRDGFDDVLLVDRDGVPSATRPVTATTWAGSGRRC